MPSWTQLLSGSDAGKDESLTEEECEMCVWPTVRHTSDTF